MTREDEIKLGEMQYTALSPITKKPQAKTYEGLVIKQIKDIGKKLEDGSLSPFEAAERQESVFRSFCTYAKINNIPLNEGNRVVRTFNLFSNEKPNSKKLSEKIMSEYDSFHVKTPSRYSIIKSVRQKQANQVQSEINAVMKIRQMVADGAREDDLIALYKKELASGEPRPAVLRELKSLVGKRNKKLGEVIKTYFSDKKKTREGQIVVALDSLNKYENGDLGRPKDSQLEMYKAEYEKMSPESKKSQLGKHYQEQITSLTASIAEDSARAKQERKERQTAAIAKKEKEKAIEARQSEQKYREEKRAYEQGAEERNRAEAISSRRLDDKMDWRNRETLSPYGSNGANNVSPEELGNV